MTRNGAIILLGVLVILSPFSGLPFSFLQWFFVILGAGIVLIGISLRKAHTSPITQMQTEPEKPVVPDVAPAQPSQIS